MLVIIHVVITLLKIAIFTFIYIFFEFSLSSIWQSFGKYILLDLISELYI